MGLYTQTQPIKDVNAELDRITSENINENEREKKFSIKQDEILQEINKTLKTIKEQNDEIIGDEF